VRQAWLSSRDQRPAVGWGGFQVKVPCGNTVLGMLCYRLLL